MNRRQKIAEQKKANDTKKENKLGRPKKKAMAGNGEKTGDESKSTLEKMLESSALKQSDNTAGSVTVTVSHCDEEDDMLSVIKRRRQLAAQAAEDKKKREAELVSFFHFIFMFICCTHSALFTFRNYLKHFCILFY